MMRNPYPVEQTKICQILDVFFPPDRVLLLKPLRRNLTQQPANMKFPLKRTLLMAFACLTGCLWQSSASAGTINLGDGSLSDWGVKLGSHSDRLRFKFDDVDGGTIPRGTGNTQYSGTGTYGGFQFKYFIEDQDDDNGTGSYLGPHSGGQNYDAEFLGVGVQDGYLVIGISTGQRTDNGFSKFAPGDIFIETANGSFAIEVGGGGTNLNGSAVDAGKTFTLNDGGFTTGVSSDNTDVVAGSVWTNPLTYKYSPIDNVPTQLLSGDYVGQALYNYSMPSNSQHAFIEIAVPLDFFGNTVIDSITWAPACDNDIVEVSGAGIATTPAPGSLTLILIGVVGLLAYQRRRGLSLNMA